MKLVFLDDIYPEVCASVDFIRSLLRTNMLCDDMRNALEVVSEITSGQKCDELRDEDLRRAASHAMLLSYRLGYSAKLWGDDSRAYHSLVMNGLAQCFQDACSTSSTKSFQVLGRGWQQMYADGFCDTVDDH